ncbi:hypothetical protein B0H10DRAFT_1945299 [Mycena sp. CBHHK59/15]|nr:hypothetical protein B0H10DRAFT_1945299 [Mycena sp. CBHHK59/15]
MIFPIRARPGLEPYFDSFGVHVRPYHGARILSIDGVEVGKYLTELATASSIYKGLAGGYESRYSADSARSLYTQEVGCFAQRSIYLGADSVELRLQTAHTVKSLTIPWAVSFAAAGDMTASFIAHTFLLSADESARHIKTRSGVVSPRRAVTAPDNSGPIRDSAGVNPQDTPQTNMFSPIHFEPSVRYDSLTYLRGISETLFTGLTLLRKRSVKHILLDIFGNRGGYIEARTIAIWSLWPTDLYPGFSAVYRVNDLIQSESELFTSNKHFMDPPIPQTVNGVKDAFSHPFLDDFGNSSKTPTPFTAAPFAGKDYVLVSNSICASTCSIFSSYLFQKHGVRSTVFGGSPNSTVSQFDGGIKGSEVTDFESILLELELAGLQNGTVAPQPSPIQAILSLRNVDKQDGILEYVWEQGTKKYQFTHDQYNNPRKYGKYTMSVFTKLNPICPVSN